MNCLKLYHTIGVIIPVKSPKYSRFMTTLLRSQTFCKNNSHVAATNQAHRMYSEIAKFCDANDGFIMNVLPQPNCQRNFSTLHRSGSLKSSNNELMTIVKQDIKSLFHEIQNELGARKSMNEMANYYFDGKGKSLRPLICLFMSQAINEHQGMQKILKSQREVAKISEMIHTSSLLHDDVIDGSDMRRGKPAVHSKFTNKQSIMTGDYVLSVAATMLARINHGPVIELLSQVLVDLVQGEFMQMATKENETDRFANYLQKSYNKTASLIAISCKAVAMLSDANDDLLEACYEYGKNTGVAFQLIDDLLDFTSSSNELGKPSLNDIKSGLATGPVLFAAQKFPEMNELIDRRFQGEDDIKVALDLISKSDGLEQTKALAVEHCQRAKEAVCKLNLSDSRQVLIQLTDDIISRKK